MTDVPKIDDPNTAADGIDASDIPQKMAKLAHEFELCKPAFIALGDENRQQIIIALLEQGSAMRVGEITKSINLSRPAVSHHLKILKDAGIISMFKRGTMNYYHIDPNKSRWDQLTTLFIRVNTLIRHILDNKENGQNCPIRSITERITDKRKEE